MPKTKKGKKGVDNALQKRLKSINDLWPDPEEGGDEDGFECPVDEGRYVAVVESMKLVTSEAEELYCVAKYRIAEGEYKGELITCWDGMETENGPKFFQRRVKRLGYDKPATSAEANKLCDEITEDQPTASITVKLPEKDGKVFTNVWINKLIEDGEASEEDETAGDEEKAATAAEEEEAEEETEEEEAEEEEAEEEEEDVAVAVGMAVTFVFKGKKVKGTVNEILEEEGKVRIKSGKKIYKVPAEKLEQAEDEPEEKPKKKKKKDK